jgi:hypothetical protein
LLLNNGKFEEAIMLSTAGDVSLCHNGLRGQSFSYRIEALEYMTDSDKAELIDEQYNIITYLAQLGLAQQITVQ